MRYCQLAICSRPIEIMTPPVSYKRRKKEFCSENCRARFDKEISVKEWEKRNATIQKSTKEN